MQFTLSLVLIIMTVLVSGGAFNPESKVHRDLIFHPPAVSVHGQWYRMLTHGFLHADVAHLFFNMYALYMFGPAVEKTYGFLSGNFGKKLFILMYLSAIVAAVLPTYFRHRDNYGYYGLGASGAVSAVIFSFYPVVSIARS